MGNQNRDLIRLEDPGDEKESEVLTPVPLAIQEKDCVEGSISRNEFEGNLFYGTPRNMSNNQDCLFLRGVMERNEEALFEWVLHKLEKFRHFLGLSFEGFEAEVKELFKAIELRRKKCIKFNGD